MIKKISSAVLICALFSQSPAFAKNGGGGGNGGVGNCNGNGNIKHGCGSSVVTPDILTQTSQGNARQPVAPIPTANQLPPQVPSPIVAPPLVPPSTPPMVPQPLPVVTPPLVPQQIPMATPPLVPQQTPMAVPPLVPQQIPMATPPLVPQQTPMAVPPLVPQQTPMAVPPLVPQQTPIAVPPLVPQQVPIATPPLVPQQTPMAVPPLVPQQVPIATPPLVPQQTPMAVPPLVPQSAPQLVSINTPLNILPSQNTPPLIQPITKPQVEVTLKASSAGFNGNMIANTPGRQPADSYALFRNDATGAYRECVVSGLETRKVILATGEVVYRGTLPGFRTVSNEVADIPSWHPHEAGCIISIEHKKREVR